MKILFLTYRSFYPQDNGAVVYSLSLLERLRDNNINVDVISFFQKGNQKKVPIDQNFLYVPFKSSFLSMISFRWPLTIKKYYKKEMLKQIIKRTNSQNYDYILIDHLQMSSYISYLKNKIPLILVEHNVESDIWKKYLSTCGFFKKFPVWINYKRMVKAERKAIKQCSYIVCVSEEDKQFFKKINPMVFNITPINKVSNNLHTYLPLTTIVLLFIGSYSWFPNEKAALFLEEKVCPLLESKRVDYILNIVGSNPTKKMIKASNQNRRIKIKGFVNNVEKEYNAANVFINPIFDGGGINIKLLNSLASGIPILSTPFGIRGTQLSNNKNVILFNSEIDCASLILSIYEGKINIDNLSKEEKQYYVNNISNSPELHSLVNVLESNCKTANDQIKK